MNHKYEEGKNESSEGTRKNEHRERSLSSDKAMHTFLFQQVVHRYENVSIENLCAMDLH